MTERFKAAARAFEEHSAACPECSNPEQNMFLCERGKQLMEDFYDALQAAARQARKDEGQCS